MFLCLIYRKCNAENLSKSKNGRKNFCLLQTFNPLRPALNRQCGKRLCNFTDFRHFAFAFSRISAPRYAMKFQGYGLPKKRYVHGGKTTRHLVKTPGHVI